MTSGTGNCWPLKGALHPFTVINDHKNLEYIQNAKRPNSRQACWTLYFTRFNFTIHYCPGNKNVKVDSLSHIHQPDSPAAPEPILFPAIIVSPIQWELDVQICITTLTEPTPLGGPEREDLRTSLPLTLLQPRFKLLILSGQMILILFQHTISPSKYCKADVKPPSFLSI